MSIESATPKPARPAPTRLRLMDALRLVAALAVVLFHFTARDHIRWGRDRLPHEVFGPVADVTRYGYAGVHLFFVISGFVILMSLWGRSVSQFVASRVSRLFPAYWVAVLLTATLRWWWPSFGDVPAGAVLVNLTMLQDPFGVPRVDGVYWTLWIEMQFYLLMVGLLLWGITVRRVLAVAALVPTVMVAVALWFPALSDEVGFLGWSPLFGAGMVLYVLYREGGTLLRWVALIWNVALAASYSALRTVGAIDAIASGGVASPLILALVTVGVVALVAAVALVPRLREVDWRVLTVLGVLTYPLYLVHEYVGWALIETLHPVLGVGLTLVVAIVVCGAVAWGMHLMVERPIHRRLRGAVQRGLERMVPGRLSTGEHRAEAADPAAITCDDAGTELVTTRSGPTRTSSTD